MNKPIIIGVSGGSGSGKSTVVERIIAQFPNSVVSLQQDCYYKDQSHLTMEERIANNYDHPTAFDNDLMLKHLSKLQSYKSVKKPVYNFKMFTRERKTTLLSPKDVIIVEGLLILANEKLRDMMEIKVYVDTDADVRILRRMKRDVIERGRTLESVVKQYLEVVRPMHFQFIEPSKRFADIIIPEGGHNDVAIDLLVNQIHTHLLNCSHNKIVPSIQKNG